jgi:DNA primase
LKYNELKAAEEQGITSLLTEIIEHRKYVKENYRERFNQTLSEWRKLCIASNQFNARIMQNWAHLFVALDTICKCIDLPAIDVTKFNTYCFERAKQWSKFIRSSDTLSEFWNTLLFLAEQKQIIAGWDYKIDTVKKLTIRSGRDESVEKELMEPTKVLFIRLNNIHKIYEQTYRSRTGKQGMSMENLLHYFGSRQYYIGPIKSIRWERKAPGEFRIEDKITNGYAFYYDQLDIDIESQLNYPTPVAYTPNTNSGKPFPDASLIG